MIDRAKANLRKVTVKELKWNNRPNYDYEEFKGYFHKWFDDISELNGVPIQKALIEKEDGTVLIVSLDKYSLKFNAPYEHVSI